MFVWLFEVEEVSYLCKIVAIAITFVKRGVLCYLVVIVVVKIYKYNCNHLYGYNDYSCRKKRT